MNTIDNKQHIPIASNYDRNMNNEAKNFSKNLRILMDFHKDTQITLSKKSGVSQKTISNMLNPGDTNSPNLANVELIAKAYKLQTWHLLYPNAPLDILINTSIEKFVENYAHADKEMREAWARVAEISNNYKISNKG
jgi:transcriptional regulator with XRE-family HTH domain